MRKERGRAIERGGIDNEMLKLIMVGGSKGNVQNECVYLFVYCVCAVIQNLVVVLCQQLGEEKTKERRRRRKKEDTNEENHHQMIISFVQIPHILRSQRGCNALQLSYIDLVTYFFFFFRDTGINYWIGNDVFFLFDVIR